MSDRSGSLMNFPHETIAIQSKDITWKGILFSIGGGYACVALFFILARYTALSFLFCIPGRRHHPHYPFYEEFYSFDEKLYYMTMVVFFVAYTIYAVSKIIWFSLRKNSYCSAIYGSIRRFFETYVLCFYVVFIPFCLMKFCIADFYGNSMFMRNDVKLFAAFFSHAFFVTSYLMPLILTQRVIIMCYQLAANKPIGKREDKARYWRTTEAITSTTLYSVVCFSASLLWEICYWYAMMVLLPTICALILYIWFVLHGDIQPMYGPKQIVNGFGFQAFVLPFIYFYAYFLAFNIFMRSLFSVLRQALRLSVSQKTSPPAPKH